MREVNTNGVSWIYTTKETNIEVFLLMLEGGIDPNIANHQGDTQLIIICVLERDALYSETGENILLGCPNWNVIHNITVCVRMLFDYSTNMNFVGLDASIGHPNKTPTRVYYHIVLMNAVRDENIGVVSAQGFLQYVFNTDMNNQHVNQLLKFTYK